MKLVIDSSVFLSALNPSESGSRTSRQLFALLKQSRKVELTILPMIVPIEVANILLQTGELFLHFEGFEAFYKHFKQYVLLDINLPFMRKLLPQLNYFKLRTNDAIVSATALLYDASIISWDKQLVRAASPFMPAFTPDEFIKEIETNQA